MRTVIDVKNAVRIRQAVPMRAAIVALLAATFGCDHQKLITAPGDPGGGGTTSAVTLVVERFDVAVDRVGDGFVGRPSLRVRETTGAGRAKVTGLRFTGAGGTARFGYVQPPMFVAAGGVLDLPTPAGLADVPMGPVTSGETTVSVDVTYQDDAGVSSSATGQAAVLLSSQPTTADVRIAAFTVSASAVSASNNLYLPAVTLVEVSGKTGIGVTRVNFETLGDGPTRVPPTVFSTPLRVAAGGSVTLDNEGDLPGISSAYRFPQVRVTISYADDGGATGSVQATASVVWSN